MTSPPDRALHQFTLPVLATEAEAELLSELLGSILCWPQAHDGPCVLPSWPSRESEDDLDREVAAELWADLAPIEALPEEEVIAILRARLNVVRAIGERPSATSTREV